MMHNLFRTPLPYRGNLTDMRQERLLKLQYKEMQEVRNYLNIHGRGVGSNHPLVKLCYGLTNIRDGSGVRAYEMAKGSEDVLSTSVGITTSLNPGTVTKGVYYENTYEYTLQVNNYTYMDALNTTSDNWMYLKPLRVVSQPYQLPMWYIPYGGSYDNIVDCSVLAISVPELAVMYHFWRSANKLKDVLRRETVEQFIGRYVLPGILESQVDSVYRNSISLMGIPLDYIELEQSPLYVLVDRRAVLVRGTIDYCERLMVKDIHPFNILTQIPSASPDTPLSNAYPMMDAPNTVINYTPMFYAHLKLVHALSLWGINYDNPGKLQNELRRVRRYVRMRRTISKLPNGDIQQRALSMLEEIEVNLNQ